MFFQKKCVVSFIFFIKTEIFFTFFGSFFGDFIRWVPSVVSVAGKWTWKVTGSKGSTSSSSDWFQKNCNDLFFLRFFWKKHFFSIIFFIKKHDFPSISIIFFAFRVPPCGRPSKSSCIPTVEPDLERSGPSPRAIICGLTNYSNHHYNMNLLIFIPVNPLLYLVN